MNNRQKTVLVLGLLSLVATGLYPPWTVRSDVPGRPEVYSRVVRYQFLFDPPTPNQLFGSVSLNVSVLLTVWVVMLAITFGLALLFGLERKAPTTTPDSARVEPQS